MECITIISKSIGVNSKGVELYLEEEQFCCENCGLKFNETSIAFDDAYIDYDNNIVKCIDCCCDDEPICCGKYCEETENLKLEKGWYRYHFGVEDMIKEQLFCKECIAEYTTSKCKGCSETYKYTEMEYRDGGAFGEALYGHNDFFCRQCIIHINRNCRVEY